MKYLILFFVLLTIPLHSQGITGSGTYADPWMLYTPANLDSMRYHLFQWDATAGYKIFKLANDIDCDGVTFTSGDTLWHGLYISPQDTFGLDGNGFSIKNLDIAFDTTRHPITWANTDLESGFIATYRGKASGSYTVTTDTIKNLILDNVKMYWDSTAASPIDNITGGILIGNWNAFLTEGDLALRIENVKVKNSVLWFNKTSGAIVSNLRFGLLVGWLQGNSNAGTGYITLYQCGVDNSILWVYSARNTGNMAFGGLIGQQNERRTRISEVYVKNTFIRENLSPATYEFAGCEVGGLVGITNDTDAYITDGYAYNVTLHTNGLHGGASDEPVVGGAVGILNNRLTNVYVGAGTYIRDNASPEANSDNLGFFVGNRTNNFSSTQNFIDTTGLSATDWYGVYGEESNTSPDTATYSSSTEMQTESHFTNENWDFTSVWGTSGSVNGGYPYLLWENPLGYTLISPIGGEVIKQDSIFIIEWSENLADTASGIDTTFIWLGIDGVWTLQGATYNRDTTFAWTVPFGFTSLAQIKIASTDSTYSATSGNFSIIPNQGSYSTIDIFDVTPLLFITGDTLIISIESIYVDSMDLFWTIDSIAWTLIQGVSVDTVNGFLQDTTFVSWVTPYFSGDVTIKATEVRDTTKYFLADTLEFDGSSLLNLFCLYDSGGTIQRRLTVHDPSCQWASPPHNYWQALMREDLDESGLSYVHSSKTCDHPYFGCLFPDEPRYVIRSGGDSVIIAASTFEGTSFVFKTKRYYLDVSGEKVWIEDLVNSVTYLLVDFTGLFSASGLPVSISYYDKPLAAFANYKEEMYVFNDITYYVWNHTVAQYDDAFHARILDSLGQAFGDWNEGYLLIAPPSGSQHKLGYVSLQGLPTQDLLNAEDTWGAPDGLAGVGKRDFFRGIHPKIWKKGVRY